MHVSYSKSAPHWSPRTPLATWQSFVFIDLLDFPLNLHARKKSRILNEKVIYQISVEKLILCQRTELTATQIQTQGSFESRPTLSFILPPCFGTQKRSKKNSRGKMDVQREGICQTKNFFLDKALCHPYKLLPLTVRSSVFAEFLGISKMKISEKNAGGGVWGRCPQLPPPPTHPPPPQYSPSCK